jgi:glycosyltransferase involved in cell wall biosynthesis
MKLLVISPVPTDPQTAGNRARVSSLITMLEALGHDVFLAYAPYETVECDAMEKRLGSRFRALRSDGPPISRITSRAKRKILRLLRLRQPHVWHVDEWFDDGLLGQVADLHRRERFEAVLVEYVFLSKIVEVFPHSVRTIIDAHDLMANRHQAYLSHGVQPAWFATTPEQEIRSLDRARAVIAIQEEEAQYLRERLASEVFCVGHVGVPESEIAPDPDNYKLLFVGSENPINIHGLEWFARSVWPDVRDQVPNCELVIAGRAGPTRTWPEGVSVVGEVASLAAVYAEATIVINPVQFGTGLPVKTIEALNHGKPLVTTNAGARGLGAEFAKALHVAADAKLFARHVVELLKNRGARRTLSRNGLETVHSWRLRQLASLDNAVKGKGASVRSVPSKSASDEH